MKINNLSNLPAINRLLTNMYSYLVLRLTEIKCNLFHKVRRSLDLFLLKAYKIKCNQNVLPIFDDLYNTQ